MRGEKESNLMGLLPQGEEEERERGESMKKGSLQQLLACLPECLTGWLIRYLFRAIKRGTESYKKNREIFFTKSRTYIL